VNINECFPAPKRDDEQEARRWRGPLFKTLFAGELAWRNGASFGFLEWPRSVTFPICSWCNHVCWDWPHFGEPVPENPICTQCGIDEQRHQEGLR
jgi:hypothetical protein